MTEEKKEEQTDPGLPPPGGHYWITKSHHIQQKGQDHPEYIEASPDNPVLIELRDDERPHRGMVKGERPGKPKSTVHVKQEHKGPKRAADKKRKAEQRIDNILTAGPVHLQPTRP